MLRASSRLVSAALIAALSCAGLSARTAHPSHQTSSSVPVILLRGNVQDGLGRPISGAQVTFHPSRGGAGTTVTTDTRGRYVIHAAGTGTLTATAPHFSAQAMPVNGASATGPQFTLALMPMQQAVVVAADAVPTPEEQVGLPVSTISRADLHRQQPLTAAAALRLQPGVHLVRTGQVGGMAVLSMRGGNGSFTKVLIDGVPVQRIDTGSYDFSTLAPAGLQEMQIVRGPDSVIYGSDAVSGVIDIHTRSGRDVPAPEWRSDFTGGDYTTLGQSHALLGSWKPLDYAFHLSSLQTNNAEPNAKYRTLTYSGDTGLQLPGHTEARLVARHTFSTAGQPNAWLYYGVPDDSFERQGETYSGIMVQQQTTAHWFNRWQVTQGEVNYHNVNPAPTGTPYNAFGSTVYLGNPVTIQGANGYTVAGQAILDYGGAYPSRFDSETLRRDANWETVYSFAHGWNLIGGYRYYNERGLSAGERLSRHDHGAYAEVNGALWNRLFASAGISSDRNTPFGATTNPQGSLGFFPRLSRQGWFNETRLRVSGGTALKDPNLFQEQSSLYQELASVSGGDAVLTADRIGPIHPQRSHNFDLGIDQYLFQDRVQVSVTGFDNRYYDLIEFVPNSALPQLGVPADAAQMTFGANVNSLSESAKGIETEARLRLASSLQLRASYTLTDARVLKSLSSDALYPSFNPAWPTVPIGAYSPLVGARPFRVAPDAGSVEVMWERQNWALDSSFYASSRRDDSTFLSDANFGTSLLLPNHDMAPAYGVVNLSGFVHLTPSVTLHAAVDNLFNQKRQEVPGYPMLGLSARAGLEFTLHPLQWGRR